MAKRENIKTWLVIGGGLTLYFLLNYGLPFASIPLAAAGEKALASAVREMNDTCPALIDSITRLDRVKILPDSEILYVYTILNEKKAHFDFDSFRYFKKWDLIDFVQSDPELEALRDKYVTWTYQYKDMDGKFLWQFSVTPFMYNYLYVFN